MEHVTIALAGNPNSGKTTLFNALTGAKQRIGNWPGVTVEHKEGSYQEDGIRIDVIDLPGIYSFSAWSVDEKVSREYILYQKPDVVVNIIDASNLERNLYLTTQLLEIKAPVVVALNMLDVVQKQKIRIEIDHLEQHLGCPVVPMVASRKEGLDALKQKILEIAKSRQISPTRVAYDSVVESALGDLEKQVEPVAQEQKVNPRWLAIKLLERDPIAKEITEGRFDQNTEQHAAKIEKHVGDSIEIVIADGRYGFIHGLVKDVTHRDFEFRKTVSDSIDRVILNRILGIPIFLAVMYLLFFMTINLGNPFIYFFDRLFGAIFVDGFATVLESFGTPAWLTMFLAKGLGEGIRVVSTFIPPIFFIFLFLSFLEDSGYMARAAFVMDRFMRVIGLPGKAFIPMLIGFGCNVPAIMATRTLENHRDRILTVLVNPLMSCGARIPVYVLFATIFFPQHGGTLIFGLYMTGILLAIISGLLFKRTLLRGETSTFVMELPPYHIPTFNGVMLHTWIRLKSFIFRAGRLIMIFIILLSILGSLGTDGKLKGEFSEDSVLTAIGKFIAPVFRPMGVQKDNWEAAVGLFTGIFSKEAVVGTLNALYARVDSGQEGAGFDFWGEVGTSFRQLPVDLYDALRSFTDPLGISSELKESKADESLGEVFRQKFPDPMSVIAYLLFILIYTPCIAAIAATYRETNAGWAIFSVVYLTGLAWIIATLFYQVSSFAMHPGTSAIWIGSLVAVLVGFYVALKLWRAPEAI